MGKNFRFFAEFILRPDFIGPEGLRMTRQLVPNEVLFSLTYAHPSQPPRGRGLIKTGQFAQPGAEQVYANDQNQVPEENQGNIGVVEPVQAQHELPS